MSAPGKGRRRAQTLLGGVILLLVAVLGATLWLHNSSEELLPEIVENLPQDVDLGLDKVHYSQNEDGRKSWVLDAERAAYQRKDEELELTAVELTLFNAGRFGELRLKADSGLLRRQQKQILVKGHVEIRAQSGEWFRTSELEYDFARRRAVTEAEVTMHTPQIELSGTGMRLDLAQSKLRVLHAVRAQLDERAFKGESR